MFVSPDIVLRSIENRINFAIRLRAFASVISAFRKFLDVERDACGDKVLFSELLSIIGQEAVGFSIEHHACVREYLHDVCSRFVFSWNQLG